MKDTDTPPHVYTAKFIGLLNLLCLKKKFQKILLLHLTSFLEPVQGAEVHHTVLKLQHQYGFVRIQENSNLEDLQRSQKNTSGCSSTGVIRTSNPCRHHASVFHGAPVLLNSGVKAVNGWRGVRAPRFPRAAYHYGIGLKAVKRQMWRITRGPLGQLTEDE